MVPDESVLQPPGGAPAAEVVKVVEPAERVAALIELGLEKYGAGDLVGALCEWEHALSLDQDNERAGDYIQYVRANFAALEAQFREAGCAGLDGAAAAGPSPEDGAPAAELAVGAYDVTEFGSEVRDDGQGGGWGLDVPIAPLASPPEGPREPVPAAVRAAMPVVAGTDYGDDEAAAGAEVILPAGQASGAEGEDGATGCDPAVAVAEPDDAAARTLPTPFDVAVAQAPLDDGEGSQPAHPGPGLELDSLDDGEGSQPAYPGPGLDLDSQWEFDDLSETMERGGRDLAAQAAGAVDDLAPEVIIERSVVDEVEVVSAVAVVEVDPAAADAADGGGDLELVAEPDGETPACAEAVRGADLEAQGVDDEEARQAEARKRIQELLDQALGMADQGDYLGALEALEAVTGEDPEGLIAPMLLHRHRDLLHRIYEGYLGGLNQVPLVTVPLHEIAAYALDHRSGFVLSRIDGMLTYEDVLDVAGMPRLEVYRILSDLLHRGLIEARA